MQLSPDEQAKVLEMINQRGGGKTTQAAPQFPEVVKPRSAERDRTQGEPTTGSRVESGSHTDSGSDTESGSDRERDKDRERAASEQSTSQPITRGCLQPFGYDLFAGAPTTFAPATDIPVPAEYVVVPVDTLQVQLFGKENVEYTLPVNRDGTVNFPGIGPVSVAGMRFPEVKENLTQRVERQLIGMRVSIALGPLRSNRIFVWGGGRRPGAGAGGGGATGT